MGLGIKFLKHIERCKTLLHLIDINELDLEKSYKQVRKELGKYSKKLLDKEEIIVFNKVDLLEEDDDIVLLANATHLTKKIINILLILSSNPPPVI